MDLSDCNISAIFPPDDLGPVIENDQSSEHSLSQEPSAALPDDLEESYVEDSFVEQKLDMLPPTQYQHSSFHVGQLIRFTDYNKESWAWAVISEVGVDSEEGSFELFMRLCGDINPADNGECFQFPDDFYELWIDEVSYQHEVTNMEQLTPVDHIRFLNIPSSTWYMGWVTEVEMSSIHVLLTCENERDETKSFD